MLRFSRRLGCAALAAAAFLPVSSAAQRQLTPELLWQLERVSDPQPGPDGKWLLYTVRSYDIEANRGRSQLWLLELQDRDRRQLTRAGSNSGGCWSPRGDEVAFVSTRSGSPQIWVIPIDGGEARQVTSVEGGVANVAWSPTGELLSFTARVQLDPGIHDRHPDLPKANAKIFDSLLIRHWDRWGDGTHSHLFVVPAAGGEPRDLMAGERFDTPLPPFGGGEQIAWSPDGEELCYTAKKIAGTAWAQSTDSSLWVVSAAGGPARELAADNPGYDRAAVYSPDGRYLAYLSLARPGFESDRSRVMLLDRRSGEVRELTAGFDQSAHGLCWAPDSRSVLFHSDILGTTQIYQLPLGGEPIAITAGRFRFTNPVPAPDGRSVLCLRQCTERPAEIVRVPAASGESAGAELADSFQPSAGELLTDENGAIYADLELPAVEERWFEATDGKRIHAWVIYPPDFDPAERWPMLLYCQGGPQSQVGQWFSYRWNFHLMAARGYIVLAVNRRGLPGFGQDWNDQISGDWGGQAMADLLAATDQMMAEPFVDPERTAAVGASFGGYTVYWLMGHDQQDRFCAMIAHCGVFDLRSWYLGTEELFFPNHDLGGPFWRDPAVAAEYRQFSPSSYVEEWDTPLLVIHGQRDFRVPVTQGIQAFTAAQIQGVPSRFLYFPDESHWVLSPQNGLLWHRTFFDWLDRYCKPPGGDAAASDAAAGDEREYLLQRVDDTAVVQLHADGFEDLSLRDKLLCYHLSRAAVAGRDIFIDQKFAHSLDIRQLLEGLYLHRAAMPAEVREEIERYTALLWVHNGIHHAITARKELLQLDREQFQAAVRTAMAAGAMLPPAERRAELYAIMTDPDTFELCTNKSPGDGRDPIAASCNNLYVGVTTADLRKLDEANPLNSRVVKLSNGRIVEQVYRAGDGAGIPPGRYARELNAVIDHLTAALRYAPPETRRAIKLLIRYYETGRPEDWRAFNIAWVQDTDSVVDQINGFVEVYLDARGQKGAWEAVVSFLNREKTAAIEALAAHAQWFEDRMPWAEQWKKPDVVGISARAISVIMETGDAGPVTPIGINLPNSSEIRQEYGSKSFNLSNVIEAYAMSRAGGGSAAEFAASAAEIARAKRWGALASNVHTNLHEVVGHASGRVRDDIDPTAALAPYYSTLEEGRADLVALYWIADPELRALGMIPHPDAALARYESYARNALVQLRRVPLGGQLEEDHMRNRQMIIHWLIANSDAIAVEHREGKTYYRVRSAEAFRRGCGELLAEVMRIKATGDLAAGRKLVETYGTNVDPELHREVLARLEALDLPSVTGFVMPELRLVRDDAGEVIDVVVEYPRDLAAQMLRFSGRRR